ncbi:MAG TPA: GSCFA domain-containing protein [Acetobacteraceae bacterium]|nr:GSCFA domain-containing protein [Acetobacteraceae bacterium]
MPHHPFRDLPPEQFWRTGFADAFDPVPAMKFAIGRTDPVAAAGSCFAQHIGRHLKSAGYNFLETEPAEDGQPVFSARYGNIYTARQLHQLMLAAYGLHRPAVRVWRRADGRFVDPLRPRLFPAGFATADDVAAARRAHFAAVRRVFQECRVFVFTLGLTEAWVAADGTVLPVPPGVVEVDDTIAEAAFRNFTVGEVRQDLEQFLADLTAVNPDVRVLLTVSPVPLAATYETRHVLVSNTYSKAALRVAAEETAAAHANVSYFPSYEIITSPHLRGSYYADNFRDVTDEGVAQVMRLFDAHLLRSQVPTPTGIEPEATAPEKIEPSEEARLRYEALDDIICDEALFDPTPIVEATPEEFSAAAPAPRAAAPAPGRPPASEFLVPRDLVVTEQAPSSVLAIGSCLLQELLARRVGSATRYDFVTLTGLQDIPAQPPLPIETYDLQLVHIPLRMVMHDNFFLRLDDQDLSQYEAAFAKARQNLVRQLEGRLTWGTPGGVLTFVMNFMLPQFNPRGRFAPKFDLRNPEYFVEMLNRELEHLVAARRNCHILDMDRIAASLGRRHIQDDSFTAFNHNANLSGDMSLPGRMENIGPLADHYDLPKGDLLRDALFAEVNAMFRVVRQIDTVKLVVVDLDDTLWNGVSGDSADVGPEMAEGWPVGFIEALHYLRKRGILLAIASKNDEARVRAVFPRILGSRLTLDDFAMTRIDWRPKPESMQEILATLNLLPRNTVFIDDNPAERAAMQAAFPDIRVLGRNPFTMRRVLLLAPEMQAVVVSEESARRTAMAQAQVQRETERTQFSQEDFLRQQEVHVSLRRIGSATEKGFARALELINKTNQFNTSGKRWTVQELEKFLSDDGTLFVYEVADRYTPYGLVGAVLVDFDTIIQWVMSCRVIGMAAERAVLHALVRWLRGRGHREIIARLRKTELNHPSWALYSGAGFEERDGDWVLAPEISPDFPNFVAFTDQEMAARA